MNCKDIDELPEIMLAPGFNRFFYTEFVKRFRDRGYFECVNTAKMMMKYQEIHLNDPDGYYDIIGFNPLVFLVDKSNDPDLATPRQWSDLTKEEYQRRVAYRGHNDREFCEGILLNLYQQLGEEGIRKLGQSVKCRLHPSQMVKYAGSGLEEAPAVSVIPYSFACMARLNQNVEIVWPKDGAILNPLVMLVKRNCKPAVNALAMELSDIQISSIFSNEGFYSVYHESDSSKINRNFRWVGWDFIKNHNLNDLLHDLNQIMFEEVHGYRKETIEQEKEGGCGCI
jgi:ABC-type Fe3+ transport system substrate-binding protein